MCGRVCTDRPWETSSVPPTLRRPPLQLVLAVLCTMPGAYLGAADYLHLPHPELAPPLAAMIFGVSIVGAAFLLSWAAEAAQVDISAGLALAVLALLAVLPEYAVDFVFSYQAGQVYAEQGHCAPTPEGNPCALALANMTGANRVLVGLGWPLVVLVASVAAYRARRARGHASSSAQPGRVALAPAMSVEVVFLGLATLYSLTLPLRASLTLIDAAVLVAIFGLYVWRLSRAPVEPPDLAGASGWIGEQPRSRRRWLLIAAFGFAGLVILCTAEHFAEGLVSTGQGLGVDPFILVQWVAPLASESPELIVACLYAWRLKASDSLGTLLSSKVNQWTLLVGTIPIVFALSAWTTHGLPLDEQQRFELLLTAAQSLLAVSLLVDLGLTVTGASTLLVLFSVQFVASITLPPEVNRPIVLVMSGVYLVLAVFNLVRSRRAAVRVVRDGLVAPLDELPPEPALRG
jgi:cation:H+ antiporter